MANHYSLSTDALDATSLAALVEAIEPYPLSAEHKDAMRARLFARLDPDPPAGTRTVRAADMKWISIAPLVELKILRRDEAQKNQTVLLRLQPGAVLSGHEHTLEEECLVLEGEIRLGDYYVREGDMHIADVGCTHADITTDTGALLLVRAEIHEAPNAH